MTFVDAAGLGTHLKKKRSTSENDFFVAPHPPPPWLVLAHPFRVGLPDWQKLVRPKAPGRSKV